MGRSHHLPAHIPMISNKPDLLQMDRPIWRILPHLRPICVAGFVQSQSLKPGSDTGADVMIVKLVFSLKNPPEPPRARPKRFDRVPNPNPRDWNIQVAIFFCKGPQIYAAVPIIAIGHGNMTLGGLIAPQQPNSIDRASSQSKKSHRPIDSGSPMRRRPAEFADPTRCWSTPNRRMPKDCPDQIAALVDNTVSHPARRCVSKADRPARHLFQIPPQARKACRPSQQHAPFCAAPSQKQNPHCPQLGQIGSAKFWT